MFFPIQLDINRNRDPTTTLPSLHNKIQYLQQMLSDLDDKNLQMRQSLKTNKQILNEALKIIQKLKNGMQTQDLLQLQQKIYAKLQKQNITLREKLESIQQELNIEKSNRLLMQQIKQEEQSLHRQIIAEYQQKISILRQSIHEKQHHIQLLQNSSQNEKTKKYKGPRKQLMCLIQGYDLRQQLIEMYKQENQRVKVQLGQEKYKNLILMRQKQKYQSNKEIRKGTKKHLWTLLHNDEQCLDNIKTLKQIGYNCNNNSQNQTGREMKNSIKCDGQNKQNKGNKQNNYYHYKESLFSKVVVLYKKQKLNNILMTKKHKQVVKQNQQLKLNIDKLIKSNTKLANQNKIIKQKQNLRSIILNIKKSSQQNPINTLKFDLFLHQHQKQQSNHQIKYIQYRRAIDYLKSLHQDFNSSLNNYLRKISYSNFHQQQPLFKSFTHHLIPDHAQTHQIINHPQNTQNCQQLQMPEFSQIDDSINNKQPITYAKYFKKKQQQEDSIFSIFD